MSCWWGGGRPQILQLLETISYKQVSWVGVKLCTHSPFSVVEYFLACAELVLKSLSSYVYQPCHIWKMLFPWGSSTSCGSYNIPIPSSAYIWHLWGEPGVLAKSSHLVLSAPKSHPVHCLVVGLLVPIHCKKQLLWWRQSDAVLYGHSNMPLGVTWPLYSFSRIVVLAAILKLQFTDSPKSSERKLKETHKLREKSTY